MKRSTRWMLVVVLGLCALVLSGSATVGAQAALRGSKLTAGDETGAGLFGSGVALSADGTTAVIGGSRDNGNVGAAWVFTRTGSTWTQQGAKLTASDESGWGYFGSSVALSADGNTALIGGLYDNNSVGAAWVFTRTGSTWTQQGTKLTASDGAGAGSFGSGVALSADGNTALIGGYKDNGYRGAVWVFTRTGSAWTQQGTKLTAGDETGGGDFGYSVALSSDANTALIGGYYDNNNVGAAWVFTRTGSTWAQQGAKLTASDDTGGGDFGYRVALSADGNTALISGARDNSWVGAAWVFTRTGSTWAQQGAKLTADDETGVGDFGVSVALSADGNTALIGGPLDNNKGAAWWFTRTGSTWAQQGAKLTAGDETGFGSFGASVALPADGTTALIGGPYDNNSVGAAWGFSEAGVDTIAPTAAPTQVPAVNANGWNATDVTVTWNWADEPGGSGIDPAYCSASSTSSGQGTITLTASCDDLAGNAGIASYTVNVDKTAPTAFPRLAPVANVAGWNATDVTVTWEWADEPGGSGIGPANCTTSTASLGEGTMLLTATCDDLAGNPGTAFYMVRVDKTAPLLSPATVTTDATTPDGATVTYSVSATDPGGSGVSSVGCAPPSDTLFAIGETTVSCTAIDLAGNTTSAGFGVHVEGASGQVADLIGIVGSYDLGRLGKSLTDRLVTVQRLLDTSKKLNRREVCKNLDSFLREVKDQTGKKKGLTTEQAAGLTIRAERIKAVIGC